MTSEADEPNVTLLVWGVPRGKLPRVLWRMARDRRSLRRTPGVRFAKLLGTAEGRWFGPVRADLTRWAAIITWAGDRDDLERIPAIRRWSDLATTRLRLDLTPLVVRGSWAGRQPFPPRPGAPTDTTVLALTRARLRPSRAAAFWRAIGPPAVAVTGATGLLATFGIGEAPVGWQGTVSVWRGTRDLVEFAYRHPDHRRVMDETPTRRWYAEELFARFAVDEVDGDRGLVGWKEDA